MKKLKAMCLPFLYTIVILSVLSCAHEQGIDALQTQIDNIDFELAVLDENGEEKSVFDQGTDVNFVLLLNNNSEQDLLWEYHYDCRISQQADFLLVYKLGTSDNRGEIEPVAMGKPYNTPVLCLDINLPARSIPPGEYLLVSDNWSDNKDNSPLTSGKYFTEFFYTLNINGYNKTIDVRVDFEIR
jgi:hypothetical protein